MWLTTAAIRRPVFIIMLIGAFIVLGIQSVGKMPVEQNPKVDFPYVTVSTVYPGAGPHEVEQDVSKPIEDAVGSVNAVKNVTSKSQEGLSVVSVEFYLGTNLDVAASDVREKLDTVRRTLPKEIDPPTVSKLDISQQPILFLSMNGPQSSRDLRTIADNVVKDRLGQVSGVAAVVITGGDIREILVEVDKDRLDAYGLSIQDVSSAIAQQNRNVPSGRITEGRREYAVRLLGEFANVEEIRNLRLSFRDYKGQQKAVYLRDLASVTDSIKERTDGTRVNGHDSVGILIQKQSEANTVDVADGIKKQLERLKKDWKSSSYNTIQFSISQDDSKHVRENLGDVQLSLILGALLAVLVVFMFLHNVRGTMIVAIAIPTSIIATFLPIYSFGFTLNQMTMLALSLSVGILVDDSIVVLENIYRHLIRGESPEQAAINGRSEIGLAAITITLVDVVVFVPIAFMGGIVGMFFRSFGITVACATLFSLLVSFTLTPMLASRWYQAGEGIEAEHGVFGAINRFYSMLDRRYRRALEWAVSRHTTFWTENSSTVRKVLGHIPPVLFNEK